MESSERPAVSLEADRRRASADGQPFRLADGQEWLFATPRYQPASPGLVHPAIAPLIDRIFADSILRRSIQVADVEAAAIALLRENYDLSSREIASLLAFESEDDWQRLCQHVVALLFGSDDRPRSYTDWVRQSLLANGLAAVDLESRDVMGVLSILVATNRTSPLTQFVDVCRIAEEEQELDQVI